MVLNATFNNISAIIMAVINYLILQFLCNVFIIKTNVLIPQGIDNRS